MKKYRVNVNGTSYEVELEELSEVPASSASQPAAAQQPASAPTATAGGESIAAPMPGNILDIRVAPGDNVKAGDVLMILEAMKMENEIMCPRDGRIASIAVKKGDTVESDSILCVLE